MDGAQIVSLLIALGAGGILLELIKRLIDAFSGRGRKRRDEVDRAWRRGDHEAAKRRIVEEYASRQTRRLIEAPCIETSTIEPFPSYPKENS